MAALSKNITRNRLNLRILSTSEIRSLHCIFFFIFRLGMPLTIPDETMEKGNAKRLQIISLLH